MSVFLFYKVCSFARACVWTSTAYYFRLCSFSLHITAILGHSFATFGLTATNLYCLVPPRKLSTTSSLLKIQQYGLWQELHSTVTSHLFCSNSTSSQFHFTSNTRNCFLPMKHWQPTLISCIALYLPTHLDLLHLSISLFCVYVSWL